MKLMTSVSPKKAMGPPAPKQLNLLPVQEYRYHLAEFIHDHLDASTLIVIGDTGSGKTTQIPQILLHKIFDPFFHGARRKIAVTQPRRVAAVSIADRVSKEIGCQLGQDVGYSVRFEAVKSEKTKLEYMTDGMLVRYATSGDGESWLLNDYNMIILDEVHERSLHTDVLLGLVRKAQIRRKKLVENQQGQYTELKVIVMSATIEVEKMQQFWKNAPVLFIPGRTFPVDIKYSPKPIEDYIHSCLVAVFQIHRNEPPGSILVFVTGREEIDDLIARGKQIAQRLPESSMRIAFWPLHASLPVEAQRRALEPVPVQSLRKVIFATNVAETSLTIPGVKYVIDSGFHKAKQMSPSGLEMLKIQHISQAQAWQRTGRAGREQAGVCYRLYTEPEFEKWPLHPIAEIHRSNLATVVLYLASMGLNKPLSFSFFDPPEKSLIEKAVEELTWLGAVSQEKKGTDVVLNLLEDGKQMAALPLEPKLSRCILAAKTHSCMQEMLVVVAMLTSDSPFFTLPQHRADAVKVWEKFHQNEGDHLTLLKIYQDFKAAKGSKEWCKMNHLNFQNLQTAQKTVQQLKEMVIRLKIPISSCGITTSRLRSAICEGMFMNAAERLPDGTYVTVDTKTPVFIHPTSSLFKSRPACVVYNELVQTTKPYIRTLCLVDKKELDAVGSEYFAAVRKHISPSLMNSASSVVDGQAK